MQEVKIDRAFVSGMVSDRADQAIVTAVIGLARSLSLSVVAEGVEDEHCLAMLAHMGCDVAQGYYLARPLEADALIDWLAERTATRAPSHEPNAITRTTHWLPYMREPGAMSLADR